MWFLAVDGSYFFLKIVVDGSFSNFHRSITLKCPTVQTGCQVVVVNDKDITVKVKSTGDVCLVSHGLIVYLQKYIFNNGLVNISTLQVIRDFMEEIGQTKRHVLATNEWLRVKGCEDVYAIGDCSSITQRKIMDDITSIFEAAGKNNSGTLTIEEFQEVMDDIILRYPQEIDIEVFKLALYHADSQVKSLPATAQVAAQQGAYLARCLNCRDHAEENPEGPHDLADLDVISFLPSVETTFVCWTLRSVTYEAYCSTVQAKYNNCDLLKRLYRHLGQFAPLCGEQAAAELPGDWVSMGHSTQWLWYSVYASKQVSWATRVLVMSDWTRRFIFGRDSSRV
ncbi:External alternative NAD(P)H-ubiquinone oxidoreductase B1, mitochondrial [Glycine soja]|uniref:NADH:ubiquinone reductase (non-electrogenic) n=2 Tax=Glycine subgen. Soja TaxID=1462606 RepID=A0A0R0JV82_SOYBN|nr:External alternative NAD(P)H-ubiquinone oxidoreductase B1, mitochondrial [Glycine soja]